MEKYDRAGQTADDSMIRRMRSACWINEATDTQWECAFPRQQWLRECSLLLRLDMFPFMSLSQMCPPSGFPVHFSAFPRCYTTDMYYIWWQTNTCEGFTQSYNLHSLKTCWAVFFTLCIITQPSSSVVSHILISGNLSVLSSVTVIL
jgi:hypothetical protein